MNGNTHDGEGTPTRAKGYPCRRKSFEIVKLAIVIVTELVGTDTPTLFSALHICASWEVKTNSGEKLIDKNIAIIIDNLFIYNTFIGHQSKFFSPL